MKRFLCLGLLGLVWLSSVGVAQAESETAEAEVAAPAEFDAGRFEAYVDGLVSAQFNDHRLAGMTLVVIRDSQVVINAGYGYADLASETAVDPTRHLFRPGSISKLVTWTAVMQMVEQGKLDLNVDLARYVDQFELPNEFDEPMTMSHLMTHTPGLEDGAAGYLFGDEESDLTSLPQALKDHIPAQVRPPGESPSYSNWGTALAGLVVANISGQTFEQYVDEHIFAPLNMTGATFEEPLPDSLAAHMSTGYIEENGALTELGFEYIKNFGPAGAMSASGSSMARFMLAHLNEGELDGQRILQPDTVRLMHSKLRTPVEGVVSMAHGFYEVVRNGHRFISHGGDTIAFHSDLLLDPTGGFGVYISFNAPQGAEARSAIVNGIVDYFYGVPKVNHTYAARDGVVERMAQVLGDYRINRRSYTQLEGVIALGGDFTVAPAGPLDQGAIQVQGNDGMRQFVEVSDYVFAEVGGTDQLVFKRDDAGAVTQVYLGSLPIIAFDRLSWYNSAGNHQLIIGLGVITALFVVINYLRNRRDGLTGGAAQGRLALFWASVFHLLFVIAMGIALSGLDMNRAVFDFPPSGTTVALVFPVLAAIATFFSVTRLGAVWQEPACNRWASLRYTGATLLFVLLFFVYYAWNLIGWRY